MGEEKWEKETDLELLVDQRIFRRFDVQTFGVDRRRFDQGAGQQTFQVVVAVVLPESNRVDQPGPGVFPMDEDSRSRAGGDDRAVGQIFGQFHHEFVEGELRFDFFEQLKKRQTEFVRLQNRSLDRMRLVGRLERLILVVNGRVERVKLHELIDRRSTEIVVKIGRETKLDRTAAERRGVGGVSAAPEWIRRRRWTQRRFRRFDLSMLIVLPVAMADETGAIDEGFAALDAGKRRRFLSFGVRKIFFGRFAFRRRFVTRLIDSSGALQNLFEDALVFVVVRLVVIVVVVVVALVHSHFRFVVQTFRQRDFHVEHRIVEVRDEGRGDRHAVLLVDVDFDSTIVSTEDLLVDPTRRLVQHARRHERVPTVNVTLVDVIGASGEKRRRFVGNLPLNVVRFRQRDHCVGVHQPVNDFVQQRFGILGENVVKNERFRRAGTFVRQQRTVRGHADRRAENRFGRFRMFDDRRQGRRFADDAEFAVQIGVVLRQRLDRSLRNAVEKTRSNEILKFQINPFEEQQEEMFVGAKALFQVASRLVAEGEEKRIGRAKQNQMFQLAETRRLRHVVFDLPHDVLRRLRASGSRQNANQTRSEEFFAEREKSGRTTAADLRGIGLSTRKVKGQRSVDQRDDAFLLRRPTNAKGRRILRFVVVRRVIVRFVLKDFVETLQNVFVAFANRLEEKFFPSIDERQLIEQIVRNDVTGQMAVILDSFHRFDRQRQRRPAVLDDRRRRVAQTGVEVRRGGVLRPFSNVLLTLLSEMTRVRAFQRHVDRHPQLADRNAALVRLAVEQFQHAFVVVRQFPRLAEEQVEIVIETGRTVRLAQRRFQLADLLQRNRFERLFQKFGHVRAFLFPRENLHAVRVQRDFDQIEPKPIDVVHRAELIELFRIVRHLIDRAVGVVRLIDRVDQRGLRVKVKHRVQFLQSGQRRSIDETDQTQRR